MGGKSLVQLCSAMGGSNSRVQGCPHPTPQFPAFSPEPCDLKHLHSPYSLTSPELGAKQLAGQNSLEALELKTKRCLLAPGPIVQGLPQSPAERPSHLLNVPVT